MSSSQSETLRISGDCIGFFQTVPSILRCICLPEVLGVVANPVGDELFLLGRNTLDNYIPFSLFFLLVEFEFIDEQEISGNTAVTVDVENHFIHS